MRSRIHKGGVFMRGKKKKSLFSLLASAALFVAYLAFYPQIAERIAAIVDELLTPRD